MPTFYTYRSFEEFDGGRSYIGYRKCPAGKTPKTDPYLGSYTDKTFTPTAKEILGTYDSQGEALQAEIALHKQFDVARNPHFANKAKSISTGFCIAKHSEEAKRKISEAKKGKFTGEDNPLYGKTLSPEHRRKISEAKKGKFTGENNPMYGKSHSDEARRKMSEANKGENNPLYGKSPSEKTRKKISESKSKLIDWVHPYHGKIFQTSATDLVRLFPGQKLHQPCLNRVALGERSHHKGWQCVNIEPSKNENGTSQGAMAGRTT
jgi:hypothetical protein